jgi:hypothetical protein
MVVAREESEMAHASPSAHLGHWFVFLAVDGKH